VRKLFSDSVYNVEQFITGKKIEQLMAEEVSRKNYYLSLESFSQGRDFLLAENKNAAPAIMVSAVSTTVKEISRGGELQNENTALAYAVNRKYALLFATNKYSDPRWPALNNPTVDADALKKVLADKYGFEVDLQINQTKTQIYRKIDEYTKKNFEKNDQLVILFAGHGYFDIRRNEGYLVTSDAKWTDIDFDINYYPMSTLMRDLAHIPAEHIMVLMDACHGGAICESAMTRGNDDIYSGVKLTDVLKQHLEKPNRIILTSGRKDQNVLDGTDGHNSPFMFGILSALESKDAKDLGYVTYADLVKSVDRIQKQSQSASAKFGAVDNYHFIFFYGGDQKKKSTVSF
jgi:uncharacterized caspase-like protein